MIADTPADPGLTDRSVNCVFTPNGITNGFTYAPDMRNVMSYGDDNCLDRFSPMQVNAMKNTITSLAGISPSFPIPSISGSDIVCSNNLYSVSGILAGFSPLWSSSAPAIAYVNSVSNQPWAYITKASSGYTTITTQISDGCQTYSVHKELYANTPLIKGTHTYGGNTYPVNLPSTGIGVSSSTANINIDLSTTTPTSGTTFVWNVNSTNGYASLSTYGNGNTAYIYLSGGSYMNVTCNAYNICGYADPITFYCYNYSWYNIVASPNPTSENLTVNANLVSDNNRMAGQSYLKTTNIHTIPVKLLNGNNRLVANGVLANGVFKCSLTNVPNGTYYLQISEGETMMTKQIIVRH